MIPDRPLRPVFPCKRCGFYIGAYPCRICPMLREPTFKELVVDRFSTALRALADALEGVVPGRNGPNGLRAKETRFREP